jgi:hypothetical protein
MALHWKIGVEVELLAPPGSSRLTLATALATAQGGSVRRVLHQDSEPSKVPGHPIFYNVTLGFEALDAHGDLIARCVDDLTLQDDLNRRAPPQPGWWRMICDDERLLRLLSFHTDPSLALPDALAALPPLFRGHLLAAPGGIFRLVDSVGAPLAIAAPLPGERERPCEVITPPLTRDHAATLDALLDAARAHGFSIPREGATHIHFDADPLRDPHAIANLVNLLSTWGSRLRTLCDTPPHFRRVGGWPPSLLACVNAPDFRALPWPDAQARLKALELSKYCDFNLKNVAYARADRHTFEARIFPSYTRSAPIIAAATLFQAILTRCLRPDPIPPLPPLPWHAPDALALLDTLDLDADALLYWRERALLATPSTPPTPAP